MDSEGGTKYVRFYLVCPVKRGLNELPALLAGFESSWEVVGPCKPSPSPTQLSLALMIPPPSTKRGKYCTYSLAMLPCPLWLKAAAFENGISLRLARRVQSQIRV